MDGSKVAKDVPRVEAYGAVDEASAHLGLALAQLSDPLLVGVLTFFQHRLYNCSSNLATPPDSRFTPPVVSDQDVAFLEQAVDRFEAATGPLSQFVLPGGTIAAAQLHVARTVIRRAERRVVRLAALEPVDPLVLKFLNRGSDLLFAAARFANWVQSTPDASWDRAAAVPRLPPNRSPAPGNQ